MDLKPPIISVIMPIYNGALFVQDAINSILNQSFTDFEFIIINDGSTDDSAMIISDYARRDQRIMFINNKQNSGLINVLNQGLSIANGKYIARMDADDISFKNRFAEQVRFLDAHPEVGVVGSNVHFIDSLGCRISNFINNPKLPQTPEQISWALSFSCCLLHPTIMARRAQILNVGGYDKNAIHAEDYDLWVRMAATTKLYNLPQKLLLLRRHETNITVIHIATTLKNSKQICQRYLSSFFYQKFSLEILNLIWGETLNININSIQLVNYYEELFKSFIAHKLLKKADLRFINGDIVRRILDLFFSEKVTIQHKEILLIYAFKKNPIIFFISLLKIILRKAWKKIKNFIQMNLWLI